MELETDDIAAGELEPSSGALYVIGTPIGNLGDLSPRAKYILSKVTIIACEDTRHSGQLLKHFKIKAKLISFHKHNTFSRIPKLMQALSEGKSIALISDAGLPGINDPGEELVAKAKDNQFNVICIPGPCAAITALVSSGLPSSRFCFEGFLPSKPKDRKSILKLIAKEKRTIIIYESPHRLLKLLKELSDHCGKNRPLQVARELTKKHEEFIGPTINSVIKHFLITKPKGEFTLILGGLCSIIKAETTKEDLLKTIKQLLSQGKSSNDIAKELSLKKGVSKNFLYSLILQSKKQTSI
nr:16S rRNA (cytidine(1402)-2'-O)-methyltransferase [Prochlorococcus marinus]